MVNLMDNMSLPVNALTERQIAAQISSTIGTLYIGLTAISFVLISQLSPTSLNQIIQDLLSPADIAVSIIFYSTFSVFASWLALGRVLRRKVLTLEHSADEIAKQSIRQLFIPHTSIFGWQDIVGILTRNLIAFFVGILVMLPALVLTRFLLGRWIQTAQSTING